MPVENEEATMRLFPEEILWLLYSELYISGSGYIFNGPYGVMIASGDPGILKEAKSDRDAILLP